jgi:hypothetical protein
MPALRHSVRRITPVEAAAVRNLPAPLAPKRVPRHPAMAEHSNCIHDDSYMSDVMHNPGPTAARPHVDYFQNDLGMGGLCPAFGFDSRGRVVTVTFTSKSAHVIRLDPRSLEVRSAVPIPPRKIKCKTFLRKGFDGIFRDTSGGAYYFVDHRDRAVVPATTDEVWVVGDDDVEKRIDLRPVLAQREGDDKLTAVLPDWSEREDFFWFVSRRGVVGLADARTGQCTHHVLLPSVGGRPEEIQNGFAVNENGAFVVSNHALYNFVRDGSRLVQKWRSTYERLDESGPNPEPKPGQIDFGSGTTPTLMDRDFIVIGDGQRRTNVCVYDQRDGRLRSRVPVFPPNGSACENSFLVHHGSIIAANTYGYVHPFRRIRRKVPGLIRLDVDPATGALSEVWHAPDVEAMSSPPKLSTKTGLIYVWSMRKVGPLERRWSLLGICFRTGQVAYELPVFEGRSVHHDNSWGAMGMDPDGSLFLALWKGFLRVSPL